MSLIRREDAANLMYKMLDDDYVDGYAYLEQLRSLPTAEPERRWIPVSEALPEEETDVLVSVHFEGYKSKFTNLPQIDFVEIASHIEGAWSSPSDEYKAVEVNHHVVAWAKLPEPWRCDE